MPDFDGFLRKLKEYPVIKHFLASGMMMEEISVKMDASDGYK